MGVRWSRMSWSEKNALWERWRRGESLRDIAQALRRAPSVISTAVETGGGIAPRPRRRSRLALTTSEREEISRPLARGQSLRAISRLLDRVCVSLLPCSVQAAPRLCATLFAIAVQYRHCAR